jgi:sulfonate transport system permease protein
LVLIIAWQAASMIGWLSPKFLAAPSTALLTGIKLIANGTLADHFLASARRAYLGLGIGVAIGLALAMAAGLTRIGEASIDGLVQIKRAIPTLALIPLAILWLGIGEAMKIALIASSVLVPSTSTPTRL